MKRILLGIIIGLVAFLIFIMSGGGDYLKRFGQKTEEAGERLRTYEEKLKGSIEKTKERIEELKEKTEEKAKKTIKRIENKFGLERANR